MHLLSWPVQWEDSFLRQKKATANEIAIAFRVLTFNEKSVDFKSPDEAHHSSFSRFYAGFRRFEVGIKKLCPKGFEGLIDSKKPLNHAGFSGLESDTLILFEGEYQTEIRIAKKLH